MTAAQAQEGRGSMLLVDDDPVFRDVLGAALRRRGFEVRVAADLVSARAVLDGFCPGRAIVDLKLPDGSGLELVAMLAGLEPSPRVLVLTGYASIATAVEAVKLGAANYLPKPATPEEILAALEQGEPNPTLPVSPAPPSIDRLEWEHIQRVLADHDGNVSATARALNMHRRTLQRKLAKRPVRR
ncbi:MAG: DNA-binding response regulator [Gammaproteobacteria bacterium]|nr:MAG: DNA-binding response regulator [Gammaproteobacteria bacterium]